MFSELFSPPSQLDLEEPAQKKVHTEVAAVEEEMLKQEGLPDTSKETIPPNLAWRRSFDPPSATWWSQAEPVVRKSTRPTTLVPFVVSVHKTKIACTHMPDGTLTSLSDVPGWVVAKPMRPLMA